MVCAGDVGWGGVICAIVMQIKGRYSESSVTINKIPEIIKRKGLLWLTVLEVLVHDGLAFLLLDYDTW